MTVFAGVHVPWSTATYSIVAKPGEVGRLGAPAGWVAVDPANLQFGKGARPNADGTISVDQGVSSIFVPASLNIAIRVAARYSPAFVAHNYAGGESVQTFAGLAYAAYMTKSNNLYASVDTGERLVGQVLVGASLQKKAATAGYVEFARGMPVPAPTSTDVWTAGWVPPYYTMAWDPNYLPTLTDNAGVIFHGKSYAGVDLAYIDSLGMIEANAASRACANRETAIEVGGITAPSRIIVTGPPDEYGIPPTGYADYITDWGSDTNRNYLFDAGDFPKGVLSRTSGGPAFPGRLYVSDVSERFSTSPAGFTHAFITTRGLFRPESIRPAVINHNVSGLLVMMQFDRPDVVSVSTRR